MLTKICQSCGRDFNNRKKWKDTWDEVKYCSNRCRQLKKPKIMMQKILDLLTSRQLGKTICPSEVLPPELKKNAEQMELVRFAARLLASDEKIVITQKNKIIDPNNFKGPIRLKLK